jgi:hypothetical protein
MLKKSIFPSASVQRINCITGVIIKKDNDARNLLRGIYVFLGYLQRLMKLGAGKLPGSQLMAMKLL